jgi:BirA family transcriptional regulator, biotin operon repressor / biotin---[acetyl-CoA-carboxylase] ligase
MDRRCVGSCGLTAWLSRHPGSCRCNNPSGEGAVLTPIFEEVAQTGSTNADLILRVPLGAPESLWLRADAQDGGRGRMGRVWESPPGNLFASTIVRLRPLDPPAPSLAFIIALAVVDTIKQIAPHVEAIIKWPNDILSADGAKLCGILLERSGDAVIIGVGLNLVHHPEGLDRSVNDLAALGANCPHPQAVLEILANAFDIWLTRWRDTGLPVIFRAWQAGAHPVGTALSVNLPSGEVQEGLYAGLSDDGALQLRLADGSIRVIHAADVFLI